jgi:hypothetical protein
MPPTDRFVISFAAEPPHQSRPYGRWAEVLREQFLAACADIDSDGEEIGTPGPIRWFPDRTFYGRAYVPAVARTDLGYEVFGYVSFSEPEEGDPDDFEARADFTGDVAEANPDWKLDLNEMVLGAWRGEETAAEMTLVWGVPLLPGGAVVTAELADHAVDQCELDDEQRFTLVAPDNYRGDYLEIKLWGKRGDKLAVESLYVSDDESDDEPAAAEVGSEPADDEPTQ